MGKKFTIIDLFSGCGGLSFGLQKAGFDVLLGVDNWEESLKTFAVNHKRSKILTGDISKIKTKEIINTINGQIPTLVVGGPPCQGFSLSGPRNFYDNRNRLYLEFIRIVKDLKPEGFIIENVPGLASLFNGLIKERIIKEFSRLGYSVNAKILNASDYGIPQNRKRIIFVGLKNAFFEFPKPTYFEIKPGTHPDGKKAKITVWEAISDLPLLNKKVGVEAIPYDKSPKTDYQREMRKGSKTILNHVASLHTNKTVEIISMVPEGGNYKDLPYKFKGIRNFHIAWTRLHKDKPAPTIDTGHRHHFHPIVNRVPTVRESARLQSFPDTFKFLGTKTAQYKQVGNAVPPLLAFIIGKKVLKYL
ncbi:MAG: DNA (cytosine-5-)-methyltransferase [Candidatus Nealsonbacteria bacterium CG08_land_8_20_14_0_20_36_22]|uniref:DNA (cytosine-5-)-methyltransferase n=1 Tax=Candidatus Nealsonbacteria bacterium CG08_land_8_20_14_0_20_36_22 TaxID=1974704 RepID=A0A2H0YNG8_9BACT|nr:MAG: DNA (cytosine-5-)-methyltransferase [Candidatus Nealsonbacteria bacterium CG08_land_8_20_14_0_20_36_22]